MMALMEKDIRLILLRKSTLVIYILIGIVFTYSFSTSFSGAYLTMLGTMIALSTISYDDSDNCMSFIFTLPCTRKDYVVEKYIFVYGFSFIAGMIGLVIIIIGSMVKGELINAYTILEILLSDIPILVITGGLMIPLQFKFGPEKARIVLMVIIGVVLVMVVAVGKMFDMETLFSNLESRMNAVSLPGIFTAIMLVLIIITVVSAIISSKIITSKEY